MLIVRTDVDYSLTNEAFYLIKLLSPVVLMNRMPWQLSYRYSKEELDIMEVMRTGGKEIKKRSFQIMGMEKVDPIGTSRNNGTKYPDITEMEVQVGSYYKIFKLDQFVRRAKEEQKSHYKGLLCLNDGKSELQVVVEIQFSNHILKMQIYPHDILLNLTNMPLQFEIVEDQITYPKLQVNQVKDFTYIKDYLQLSEEAFSSHSTLKEVFSEYEGNMNIFTGSLDPTAKRQLTFEGDQLDAFGSKGSIIYGKKRITLFMRKLSLYHGRVNLLLFMPKLLVINKSDWTFFLKSEATLEPQKLPKHSLDYVLIGSKVDIQAC